MNSKAMRVLALTFSFQLLAFSFSYAAEITCEFSKLPDQIVENEKFEVTADFDLAGTDKTSMNCEMKSAEHAVLKAFKVPVTGKGKKTFSFTAPKLSQNDSLIIAVWLGEDWQAPLVGIKFSDPIPVVAKTQSTVAKEEKAQATPAVEKKVVPVVDQSSSVKISVEKGLKGSIAILNEKYKNADLRLVGVLAAAFRKSGFGVTMLSADELASRSVLSTDNFFLLILPYSKIFPAVAQNSLLSFLKSGGHMLCFEGPPFTEPAWKYDNAWLTKSEMDKALSGSRDINMLFDFEDGVTGLGHSSNGGQSAIDAESQGAAGSKSCAKIDVEDLKGWDVYAANNLDQPFPEGYTMTCFWAKGDDKTKQLLVEWSETDKSRWFAVVNLTTEWKFYVLSPKDFQYWADNLSKGRGGSKDNLKPQNAINLMFGVAFGQTPAVGEGPHTYWIDQICAMKAPPESGGTASIELDLEAMTPHYKYYPLKDIVSAKVADNQFFVAGDLKIKAPAVSYSCIKRPTGAGFQKNMKSRWIPLINALDKTGEIRGTLAYLYLCYSGKFQSTIWGTYSVPADEFLNNPALVQSVAKLAERMSAGLFLTKAGAKKFSQFPDETSVSLAAGVANFTMQEKDAIVRVSVTPKGGSVPVFKEEKQVKAQAGNKETLDFTWEAGKFTASEYIVRTELIEAGKTIDAIQHEFGVLPWTPDSPKDFVTAKDGDFWLKGQKWYAYGLNYWPLYISGMGRDEYWSHWLSEGNYDPSLVERDLQQLSKEWGMNAISISAGYVYNVLDFLRICRKYGIRANLYIGEDFKFIKSGRLDLNDSLFAYDVAWEPCWGTYNGGYGNQGGRKGFEKEWNEWVIAKYGSVDNAVAEWGYPASHGAKLSAPSDKEMDSEGGHLKFICAYRRFVDDYLCRKYLTVNRKIKSMDPNHFVSFRMSGAGDVWAASSGFFYDFRGIAKAVDFLAPEGYGLNEGGWNKAKGGIFTVLYGRYAAPGKPIIWAEYGMNSWTGSNFNTDMTLEQKKQDQWEVVYRMAYSSGANGTLGWWYPGGYRVDEKSDFGVSWPDYSYRLVAQPIMKYAPLMTKAREIPKPTQWFEFDRDKYCRGYKAFFEEIKDDFYSSFDAGKIPGFRTKGTGTNSLNTPLVAVGNTEYNGNNPVKYLNSIFIYVKIKTIDGWKEVENGKTYKIKAGEPVLCQASIGNNGEAGWVCPANAKAQKGGVCLVSTDKSQIKIKIEIKEDVPYLGDAVIPEFVLVDNVAVGFIRQVELEMSADGRCVFGERLKFTLTAE